MKKELYLPTLSHWEYGNPWSSECGRARFLVVPAEGEMKVEMWPGPMSREFVEPQLTASFPISEEGIEEMRQWILDNAAQINGL